MYFYYSLGLPSYLKTQREKTMNIGLEKGKTVEILEIELLN